LCGLLPWQFFAYGLIRSSNSLVDSRYLLTKVPVPRLILPVSAALSGVPDLAVALVLLLGIMAYYRISPSPGGWLVLPLIVAVALTALSLGLFLSAMNVRYRDVGYVIPFFTQLLFFVTPVAYPVSLVSQRWRILYSLNPMTAIVEAFRYALLRYTAVDWRILAASGASISFLLVCSLQNRSASSTSSECGADSSICASASVRPCVAPSNPASRQRLQLHVVTCGP